MSSPSKSEQALFAVALTFILVILAGLTVQSVHRAKCERMGAAADTARVCKAVAR